MTGSEIEEKARHLLQDEAAGGEAEVVSSAQLYSYINDGLREMYTNFPPVRIDSTGSIALYYDADVYNPTAILWLDDFYFTPLVNYVVSRAFSADAHDARDRDRAKDFRDAFDDFFVAGA